MADENQPVRKTEVMNFIKKENQDAVVISGLLTDRPSFAAMELECYSPVWKTIYYTCISLQDIHRGDILTFSRKETKPGKFEYILVENKTAQQIKQSGIDKILSDFSEQERQLLMFAAEKIRLTK